MRHFNGLDDASAIRLGDLLAQDQTNQDTPDRIKLVGIYEWVGAGIEKSLSYNGSCLLRMPLTSKLVSISRRRSMHLSMIFYECLYG